MSKIRLKSESDINKLRESGEVLFNVLKTLKEEVSVGTVLSDLDSEAESIITKSGAQPAFKGYKPAGAKEPYPASICASVNEAVVHGIPDDYKLKDGDILTIDCGVNLNGFITDSAFTVGVGEIDDDSKKLINITKESLKKALDACKLGNFIGDIGKAVEGTVDGTNLKIIKNLTGHGVGYSLHEEPTIFNYDTGSKGEEIVPGMVLAIEPMLSFGSEFVEQAKDGSYITDDKSRSAHFETTIAVTEKGVKILVPIEV